MIQVFVYSDPRYHVDRAFIREIVKKKLHAQGINDNAAVSVSIVGRRKMAELCEQYMNDGEEHDVLSFPLHDVAAGQPLTKEADNRVHLGDIVVSHPMAVEQAFADQVMVGEKLQMLIEHAIMHLLGEHHDDGMG